MLKRRRGSNALMVMTGFRASGRRVKSGHSSWLKMLCCSVRAHAVEACTTTGFARSPTSRSARSGTSFTWSKCEWVRTMSSTSSSSSSDSTAVSAPASMASAPSTRKQVARCLASPPPEQPRTRSFMPPPRDRAPPSRAFSEPHLHLQELEEVAQLRDLGDDDSVRLERDDAGALQLHEDLFHLRRLDAHQRRQLLARHGQSHRTVRPGDARSGRGEIVNDPARARAGELGRDLVVGGL